MSAMRPNNWSKNVHILQIFTIVFYKSTVKCVSVTYFSTVSFHLWFSEANPFTNLFAKSIVSAVFSASVSHFNLSATASSNFFVKIASWTSNSWEINNGYYISIRTQTSRVNLQKDTSKNPHCSWENSH